MIDDAGYYGTPVRGKHACLDDLPGVVELMAHPTVRPVWSLCLWSEPTADGLGGVRTDPDDLRVQVELTSGSLQVPQPGACLLIMRSGDHKCWRVTGILGGNSWECLLSANRSGQRYR
jgi:hypothetical protein